MRFNSFPKVVTTATANLPASGMRRARAAAWLRVRQSYFSLSPKGRRQCQLIWANWTGAAEPESLAFIVEGLGGST